MLLRHKRITKFAAQKEHVSVREYQNKNSNCIFFETLNLTKFFILKLNELLDTTMAQIVHHIDIKPTGPTQRVSHLRPFCQADLWFQSSQWSSTEDLTFNLRTKGPQKERVSKTQKQGWLWGFLIVEEITEKYNKKQHQGRPLNIKRNI